jgi:hypothetical protein
MAYSNLVDYIKLSPNYTKKTNKKNKKITIHHMAGNLTVERCGDIFANKNRQASSNYGIGTDGRVGLYVDESNRAWTSSSSSNDSEAVTIEVANDKIGGDWHVSDIAYNKLIDLCVYICKRNGITNLKWTGTKSGTLTCHYMFANTACPGPYLKSKMQEIADTVNRRLNGAVEDVKKETVINGSYLVKVTASCLNVRKSPTILSKVVFQLRKDEVYTIIEEKNGWGKLKSGIGWISLKYTKKI